MEIPRIGSCMILFLGLFACMNSVAGYKVLVLTPFGSRSIRTLFSVLVEGLADKGHQVTFVSSGEPIPRHENVTHIMAPHSALDQMDLFEVRESNAVFRLWMKAFPAVTRELYADPLVKKLWQDRLTFDAILINSAANEMAFPFLLDYNRTFITMAPAGAEPLQLSYLGNIVSPAALPSVVVPYDNSMNFWERLVNTVSLVVMRYSFRKAIGRPLAEALRETFPDLPDPYELYPRQHLALLSRHHLIDGAIPLLPNQVEVGCLHCRPSRSLPTEMAEWLDTAGPAGVVYFSLGSFQKTTNLPAKYRKVLLAAFAKMPHRILMKFTDDDGVTLPDNVKSFDWIPQQDVLGHPNTVAFISHCGRHSAAEAVFHGVPVLGLPITFDQPRTCAQMQRRGEGLVLQWEDLTAEKLVETLHILMTNDSYRVRVEELSRRLHAQKETGLERAIWWIEYVVEHGNDYLRFSGADLSLAQYLLLDVLLVMSLVVLTSFTVVVLICRSLWRRLRKKSSKLD